MSQFDEYEPDIEPVEFTDDDATTLAHDLAQLASVVDSMDTTVEKAVTYLYAYGELSNLADTLDVVRTWRKRLADIEARCEQKTAQLGREQGLLQKGALLPDGRQVEFRGGAKRSEWHVDDVLRDVTRASLGRIDLSPQADVVDQQTGVARSLGEVIGEVRDDLVAVLPNAANSMRTTHMKTLGLTPGEYCTTTTGRRTVNIVPKDLT